MRKPKRRKPLNDLSRSPTALNVNETLIAVVELSQKAWLVAGMIPGIERQALKKLVSCEEALLSLRGRKRKRPGTRSNASLSASRPVGTAFGWRGGSEHAASRPTSFTPRAWRCHVSIGAPRPTGSTPSS
jgi:hypothetical protein